MPTQESDLRNRPVGKTPSAATRGAERPPAVSTRSPGRAVRESAAKPATLAGGPETLAIILHSGGFDRVHYALNMAAAAADAHRKVVLLFAGRALPALLATDDAGRPGWHGLDPADDGSEPAEADDACAIIGVASFEELLKACRKLGVAIMADEMGLRSLAVEEGDLRADVAVRTAGIVTFLDDAPKTGAILFI